MRKIVIVLFLIFLASQVMTSANIDILKKNLVNDCQLQDITGQCIPAKSCDQVSLDGTECLVISATSKDMAFAYKEGFVNSARNILGEDSVFVLIIDLILSILINPLIIFIIIFLILMVFMIVILVAIFRGGNK